MPFNERLTMWSSSSSSSIPFDGPTTAMAANAHLILSLSPLLLLSSDTHDDKTEKYQPPPPPLGYSHYPPPPPFHPYYFPSFPTALPPFYHHPHQAVFHHYHAPHAPFVSNSGTQLLHHATNTKPSPSIQAIPNEGTNQNITHLLHHQKKQCTQPQKKKQQPPHANNRPSIVHTTTTNQSTNQYNDGALSSRKPTRQIESHTEFQLRIDQLKELEVKRIASLQNASFIHDIPWGSGNKRERKRREAREKKRMKKKQSEEKKQAEAEAKLEEKKKQREEQKQAEAEVEEKKKQRVEKKQAEMEEKKKQREEKKQAEAERKQAEMEEKKKKAIREIDHLMALNEVEAIVIKEFGINSQHQMIVNLKSFSDIESIPRLDHIVKASILESIEHVIGSTKTISIVGISPNEINSFATVTYQVIPCLPDDNPETIQAFESSEEICVAPYDMSSSSFNIRYHPSLRPHIIKHGLAMLAYLESRLRVEAEEKPSHDIGHLLVLLLDNKKDGGIYTAWKIVNDAKKHGCTSVFLRRFLEYLEDPEYQYEIENEDECLAAFLQMRINMETLDDEEDVALCHCYGKFTEDVSNDPKVPSYIKRLLCEKIRERGGERLGPKKTLIYQMIEAALQRNDGLGVIFEGLQWDDKHYFGMRAKVGEAVAAVKPIIEHVGPRADLPVPGIMSWPPGENREDQVYNTLCAQDYVGATSKRDAFDGPAIPNWKTQTQRYSKEYTIRRFNSANEEIDDFILEAWKLRNTGCLFLLNTNELACSKGQKLLIRLTAKGFAKEANVYDDDIAIWRIEMAEILVHVPLCVGGSIREHITLEMLQRRCIVADTVRCIVSMAKGEEVSGPMLAIEAGMAQRLLHNGLNLDRRICAAFFRDYLTPAEVNAFDLYGGNGKPYKHYPDYPITKKNRCNYIRN